EVVIEVAPSRTRTYDSRQAFDPASNGGEENEVQVRTATTRAWVVLSGTPAAGAKWMLSLQTVGQDTSANAFAPTVFTVDVVAGDTLATIAQKLVNAVNGVAGYSASLDTARGGLIITRADAFFADFRITPDTTGTATISSNAGTTAVKLGG